MNAAALKHNVMVSIPGPTRLPSDIEALHSIATLGFCPVKTAERRARVENVRRLLDGALLENGY